MVRAAANMEQALSRLVGELFSLSPKRVAPTAVRKPGGRGLVLAVGRHQLSIDFRSAGSSAVVAAAIDHAQHLAPTERTRTIPVVVVPFMGEVGQRLCEQRGVSWFDLSGNAHIVAPGLRIHVQGRPNRFKRPGRPSTVFAPKSSRIARCLLLDPERTFTQRQLAAEAGLGEGYVSRLVRRMVEDGLLVRAEEGLIRPSDPAKLLDAWGEEYDFAKHRILRGHVPARSQEELLGTLAQALRHAHIQHAATGLAAAWLLTRFASYRITTLFVASPPDEAVLKKMGFREDERGANVWLVEPNDEGVFHGVVRQEGIPCVSVVQAYMDLKGHPERAKEAAEELRKQRMPWARHV